MLRHATALGGHRLDCFDTVLPELYADAGFVPVARLKWNDMMAALGHDPGFARRTQVEQLMLAYRMLLSEPGSELESSL